MSDHVYKSVEVTGSSTRASTTPSARPSQGEPVAAPPGVVRGVASAAIWDGHVAHFQVTIKIGFRLE